MSSATRVAALYFSFVAGFLCLRTGMAAAQTSNASPARVAAGLARAGLDDPAPFALVEALTTEIGERLAGTEAHARAAAWMEARLEGAHVFDDVHREPFTLTAWVRGAESAAVISPVPQPLAIAGLGGSVATGEGGMEAEIALFRSYADLIAAPPGALAGKIAVVTERMPRADDGSGYGAANPIRRRGPSEAAKRGAVAYLLRSLGTDNHRLPHAGALNYADDAPRIPAAALSNPDADQLERLSARVPVRLRLLLKPESRENARSWNVVAEAKGRERPDEVVLIGAHLDSWDLGTGAIDDGAGIAIVATTALRIAALKPRPKRTVRVVLFGAEEMDFSGPAYAAAHASETSRIVIASEADFGARPVYAVQLPLGGGGDFARMLGDTLGPLGAIFDRRPALAGGFDIHGLQAAGVPVASLRQHGSDYFDIHHTADDTLDKIDPKELAQAAAAWTAFVYLAAETGADFRAAAAAAK
jgi:hypothetical protein